MAEGAFRDEPQDLRDEDAFDVEAVHLAFEHYWYFVTYLDERCRRIAGLA